MSKIFNNTTNLNNLLEVIQNKAAGGGEDVTAEVPENIEIEKYCYIENEYVLNENYIEAE